MAVARLDGDAPALTVAAAMTDGHGPMYYSVTVDRPPWRTVVEALDRYVDEFGDRGASRLAVDLGCGAGRDAREILRRGWRVLAIDREPAAIEVLRDATPPALRGRLETMVADLDGVELPACDLVNASVSLHFLEEAAYWRTWAAAQSALRVGGRLAAMLFGDRDEDAGSSGMTCPSPGAIRDRLVGFDVEHWNDEEEDGQTALGQPHHFHLIELVARRR